MSIMEKGIRKGGSPTPKYKSWSMPLSKLRKTLLCSIRELAGSFTISLFEAQVSANLSTPMYILWAVCHLVLCQV
jgi:hypothetical protein